MIAKPLLLMHAKKTVAIPAMSPPKSLFYHSESKELKINKRSL